jgi:hypothetical protein
VFPKILSERFQKLPSVNEGIVDSVERVMAGVVSRHVCHGGAAGWQKTTGSPRCCTKMLCKARMNKRLHQALDAINEW